MNVLTGYDLTLPATAFEDHQALIEYLTPWCKKYVFQKERGEDTGYVHWQIRLYLIKPSRIASLLSKGFGKGGHLSPTSTTVHHGNSFNYVMKADTRVEGPWSDRDAPEERFLTRQLTWFMQQPLRPWQSQVLQFVQRIEDRKITLIHDVHGNSGKSIFCEFLEYKGHAIELPPFNDLNDLMQCVHGLKNQKCYLIDMPRGLVKTRLAQFYSGLESIKNGVCYDKRYAFKRRRFDRPQIVVFTNSLPNFELLSPDRWSIYQLSNLQLVPYVGRDGQDG